MNGYGNDYRRGGGAGEQWRFGNWGDRSGIYPRSRGGYGREYSRGGGRGYGAEYRGGSRFTGMESNRVRGVYGSDYRIGRPNPGQHGGYRGQGRDRGGGMNPGQPGRW